MQSVTVKRKYPYECSCSPYAWNPGLSRMQCPVHGIEGREAPEPECRCYCVGDQADASECPLHGGYGDSPFTISHEMD